MKKKIIIENQEPVVIKNEEIIVDKKNKRIINGEFINWIIYMIGYGIVLILVSFLFKSFYINTKYFGIYGLIAAIIMYVLNQTVKPILKQLTIPLTIITGGLFYPVINIIILKLTSFILGSNNFRIDEIFTELFVSALITVLNFYMEGLILKPLTKKDSDYE